MDISVFQSTVASFKLIIDITKSLHELETTSAVKAKVSELQNAVLAAQNHALAANTHQAAMIEEIRNLKEEIARVKAWEKEKQRYKLINPWRGTVLYALKEESSASEPPHWICTNCYQQRRKSILNSHKKPKTLWFTFICPVCKAEFEAFNHRSSSPEPEYAK